MTSAVTGKAKVTFLFCLAQGQLAPCGPCVTGTKLYLLSSSRGAVQTVYFYVITLASETGDWKGGVKDVI